MTQTIDPIKLKAAAEHLEWVLRQYPESEDVQGLLIGLLPLIERAKVGSIRAPAERIPFEYNFGDGLYRPYRSPSVDSAYSEFVTEMRGGLTEQDIRALAEMQVMRDEVGGHD